MKQGTDDLQSQYGVMLVVRMRLLHNEGLLVEQSGVILFGLLFSV